jgi:hypothetical protein
MPFNPKIIGFDSKTCPTCRLHGYKNAGMKHSFGK